MRTAHTKTAVQPRTIKRMSHQFSEVDGVSVELETTLTSFTSTTLCWGMDNSVSHTVYVILCVCKAVSLQSTYYINGIL